MKTPSSFKVGRILGKCQLMELIARGGMGSVYVAKHLFLHRVVAVKLLSWTFSDLLERSIEAFETGARALARLNHPNIATIYDIDEENGRPYIVRAGSGPRPRSRSPATSAVPSSTRTSRGSSTATSSRAIS